MAIEPKTHIHWTDLDVQVTPFSDTRESGRLIVYGDNSEFRDNEDVLDHVIIARRVVVSFKARRLL